MQVKQRARAVEAVRFVASTMAPEEAGILPPSSAGTLGLMVWPEEAGTLPSCSAGNLGRVAARPAPVKGDARPVLVAVLPVEATVHGTRMTMGPEEATVHAAYNMMGPQGADNPAGRPA